MQELVKRINAEVVQQAEDIFEHFHAVPRFEIKEIPNEYGGNPELHVTFWYLWHDMISRVVNFVHRPACQTQDEFVNEIRSYLLDCVDTFVNL